MFRNVYLVRPRLGRQKPGIALLFACPDDGKRGQATTPSQNVRGNKMLHKQATVDSTVNGLIPASVPLPPKGRPPGIAARSVQHVLAQYRLLRRMYWARGCCTQSGARAVPLPSRLSASTRSRVPLTSAQTVGRLCNLLLPKTDSFAEQPFYITIPFRRFVSGSVVLAPRFLPGSHRALGR